jgi:DNA-binding SARP family transcriptional activator
MRETAKRSLRGSSAMQFRILGPLELACNGEPLPLGGASQRALLALLLLHANEVVSSDRLLDELWADAPPASGVTALQVRVSQLRKALGDAAPRLETRPPGYLFRVGRDELDLERFSRLMAEADVAPPAIAAETLREALGLWRGPPLADLAYESFAQPAIRRMEELRLMAVERRIEADVELGRHAELVAELETLVVEQPLRERLRGQLMLALYRSGRQAEALEAYRQARLTLVEELGIEPSPALQELERAILRQDPELRLAYPGRSILVLARDEDRLDALLALAEALARRPPKELILVRTIDNPADLQTATATLHEQRVKLVHEGVTARAAALVSATPTEDIIRIAVEQDVDLVLVNGPADVLRDPVVAGVLADSPSDVAVLVGTQKRNGPVLVPFVGADHDWSAVELAAWFAGALDVTLLLAGPRESRAGRDASRLLANASLAVQRTLGVAAEPLLLEPGPAGLLSAATDAALVVVGLTDRWQREGLGHVRTALAAAGDAPVVLVRRGLRPGGLAPREGLTRFTWTIKA